MEKLLNLILIVLSDILPTERTTRSTRRVTMAAVCTAFSFIALLAALGCAIAAFWIYLDSIYGPGSGALGSMAALLVLSGVLILIVRSQFREDNISGIARPSIGDELGTELYRLFARHKASALLTALIAGLTAGSTSARSK